jgi:putative endonuclease
MTRARRALGDRGEEAVARWYHDHGYEVVARNWRCREGELDLVVSRPRLVVFCEVKTRSSSAFGSPAEAVTWSKQRRLRALAARWLREGPSRASGDIRFDVASVMGDRVEVIEGAF